MAAKTCVLNKEALHFLLLQPNIKIYIIGSTANLTRVATYLTSNGFGEFTTTTTIPADLDLTGGNLIIFTQRRLIFEIPVLYERSNLRLIEAGAALAILDKSASCVLCSRINSLELLSRQFYLVAGNLDRTEFENQIFSNGGSICEELTHGAIIVICCKRGMRNSREIRDILAIQSTAIIKGKRWLNQLQTRTPLQNICQPSSLPADLFEPFCIFLAEGKTMVTDAILKRGIQLGLTLLNEPLTGCIVIFDESRKDRVNRNTLDMISMTDVIVVSPDWLIRSITTEHIADITLFDKGKISRSRTSTGLSLTGVKANVISTNEYSVDGIDILIKALGGEVVHHDFNYLVCPDVVPINVIPKGEKDVEFVTYRCLTKFATENKPHRCSLSCYPLVSTARKPFLVNDTPSKIKLYVPEAEKAYFSNICLALGGEVVETSEKDITALVYVSEMREELAGITSVHKLVLSTEYLKEIVLNKRYLPMENFPVFEEMKNSEESLEFIQPVGLASPTVGKALASPAINIQHAASPIASTSKANISKPQQYCPVTICVGDRVATNSTPNISDHTRDLILEKIGVFLDEHKIIRGSFPCFFKFDHTIVVDVNSILPKLDNGTGRWTLATKTIFAGQTWDFGGNLFLLAVFKFQSSSQRNEWITNFLRQFTACTSTLGIATQAVVKFDDSAKRRFSIYATKNGMESYEIGCMDLVAFQDKISGGILKLSHQLFNAFQKYGERVRVPAVCVDCAKDMCCYDGILLDSNRCKCSNCDHGYGVKVPTFFVAAVREEQELPTIESDFTVLFNSAFRYFMQRDNDYNQDVTTDRKYLRDKLEYHHYNMEELTLIYHEKYAELVVIDFSVDMVFRLCRKCLHGILVPTEKTFCSRCKKN